MAKEVVAICLQVQLVLKNEIFSILAVIYFETMIINLWNVDRSRIRARSFART